MTALGCLVLRADASPEIGMGHVMRCLALAHAWQDHGGSARFVTTSLAPSLSERLRSEGISIESLLVKTGSEEDREQTLSIAQHHEARAIVLDGYHFGEQYQRTITNRRVPLLVIDDTGSLSEYSAPLILNQNLLEQGSLYPSLARSSRLLLGPTFALLRRELLDHPRRCRERSGPPLHWLITMGGSDPSGSTAAVIEGILATQAPELQIRVVMGELSLHRDQIARMIESDSRFEMVINPRDMSQLYSWADCAIVAGGSSNWELCAFGVPRIVCVTADNQRGVAQTLASTNAAWVIDPDTKLSATAIHSAMTELLNNSSLRAQMQDAGRRLVDGQGAARCIEALLNVIASTEADQVHKRTPSIDESVRELTLRPVTMADAERLLAWRNDPVARQASRSSDVIDLETHCHWLERSLASDTRRLWIALANGIPIGTVRIDQGEVSELSWNVAPEQRGKGYGKLMVRLAVAQSRGPLSAVIRSDNIASQRLALSLGFVLSSRDGEWLTYLRNPEEERA